MYQRDFIEFIELLNKHKVQYLVVGGYAVGFHGYPRYTGDLDIWIKISETNASNMMTVVKEFGVGVKGLSKDDFLRESPLAGVHFGNEPLRIDILNSIDGVSFDECYPNKENKTFGGVKIDYINFNDLKKNKLSSGRSKDITDVEEIEKRKKANDG